VALSAALQAHGQRAAWALFTALVLCCGAALAGVEHPIRDPAVAGRFYEADPERLRSGILAYLSDARPPLTGKPLVIVSPHAGYVYSGQIAADAFAQAAGHDYDLIVVLGTNHSVAGFADVSIWPAGAYRTPLGLLEVDAASSAALLAVDSDFRFEPTAHAREHSVEVQLPFIQVLFEGTPIVAAVIGRPEPELCERLGLALAEQLVGRNALIVASTDLSHYPDHADARRCDRSFLAAACSLDAAFLLDTARAALGEGTPGLSTCACGLGPVLATIAAARALGAEQARLVSYANSGDVAVGDRDRVVGYGALVIPRPDPVEDPPSAIAADIVAAFPEAEAGFPPLTPGDERRLLRLARETIRRYLATGTVPLPRELSPGLARTQGVFVTLNKQGRLRGCIGRLAADLPLALAVSRCALDAAVRDQRFAPLGEDELAEVEIELSLLTAAESVPGPESIVLGRDGVILASSGRSAVYLPQVAIEQGWTRDEMLTQLCRKAGLPEGCWRGGARLSTFRAEILRERE